MTELESIKAEIAKLQRRAKELEGPKKQAKVWKPEEDEPYFIASDCGRVVQVYWDSDCYDKNYYSIGNCFRTEEEVEFATDKLKVIKELKDFAAEHNGTIDWGNISQEKVYICYNFIRGAVDVSFVHCEKSREIYFSSEMVARQAIEQVGEERIKKYYLEVE